MPRLAVVAILSLTLAGCASDIAVLHTAQQGEVYRAGHREQVDYPLAR